MNVQISVPILAAGFVALLVWVMVWLRSLRGPLGWLSPSSLFAMGMLVFFIVPPLYFQFRPWNFPVPPYFEGIPLVLMGTALMGIPFLVWLFFRYERKVRREKRLKRREIQANVLLWFLLLPIIIGVGIRLYLFTLGWQSRISRDAFVVLGSDNLGLLLSNFFFYYPICYFGLVALGNPNQQRVGRWIWAADGLLMLGTLHRYYIILYMARSLVFAGLMGWRLTRRQWAMFAIATIFTITVIGATKNQAWEKTDFHQKYLTPIMVIETVVEAMGDVFMGEGLEVNGVSRTDNILVSLLDDTAYRFNDARSAAAVMMNVPEQIPYLYGETLKHITYAMIPRYFWEDKPDLREIHMITRWVMYNDSGLNPLGTVGEMYANFGFAGVLLGGVVWLIICWLYEKLLTYKGSIGPVWVCCYPVIISQLIQASDSFSRRLCELQRDWLVIIIMAVVLHFAIRTRRKTPVNGPAPASYDLPARGQL
jgi:hypothetical protein